MPKKKEIDSAKVLEVNLSELHPFKNHPFKISDDDEMQQMVDSIIQVGVLSPAIVRPYSDGGYEIISGHRRLRACELAGLDNMPVIVKDLTDDEAVIFMVDSNLQREKILPSEKAKAYKMKMDALKHQGKRNDLISDRNGPNLWTIDKLALDNEDSATQIKRYIRLANLEPDLLEKVDSKEIGFTPAVELAYLSQEEQQAFLDAMDYSQNSPSISQANRIRKLSQNGQCTLEAMREIMSEERKDGVDKITITNEELKKYFPRSFSPKQIRDIIFKLLDKWIKAKKQKREVEK